MAGPPLGAGGHPAVGDHGKRGPGWTGPLSGFVELEGVEPSSKRGNHKLSTRLFQTSFSCRGKTWTTNRGLIP